MLNKTLCKICKVDQIEEFFVNYLDDIDDQLETVTDKANKDRLLHKKRVAAKLRADYANLQRN